MLLKDNVELHLESGAVLISSLNPADITPFPQGGDGTDPDDTADGWEGGFFLGGQPRQKCDHQRHGHDLRSGRQGVFWTRMWTTASTNARNSARRSARA